MWLARQGAARAAVAPAPLELVVLRRARDRELEVVFRSADPVLLGMPWELMRDGTGPVALGKGGISRALPTSGGAATLEVPGGRRMVHWHDC